MSIAFSAPLPTSQFLDKTTGCISREWYLFLINILASVGGGTVTQPLDGLDILEAIDDSSDLDDQLPNLSNQIDSNERLIHIGETEANLATFSNVQDVSLLLDQIESPITIPDSEIFFSYEEPSGLATSQDVSDALLLANLELEKESDILIGTFTPTLISSGGGVPTYTTQLGRFTKIANRVLLTIRIDLSNVGTLAAGNLSISNLPYTSNTIANNSNALSVLCNTLALTAASMIQADIASNSSQVDIFRYAAGTLTQLAVADLTNTSVLIISGQYEV